MCRGRERNALKDLLSYPTPGAAHGPVLNLK
uniref:Uncharacterized protein n=1 Tax=Anguilla anguilla TaxID=7936 RepID=A0A0E9PGM0_ANGAN